jgi:hypothetical protein
MIFLRRLNFRLRQAKARGWGKLHAKQVRPEEK